MLENLSKIIAPIRRRVALMVGRCVINSTNDNKPLQEHHIRALTDEELGRVERFQEYGFTSHPYAGADGVIVCVGGNRNHPLLIAVEDKRYRLQGLSTGEVAIYDDLGQKVLLSRDSIEVVSPQLINVTCPTVNVKSTDITMKATNITLDCQQTTITGSLTVKEKAKLGGGQRVARIDDLVEITTGECVGARGKIITGSETATA